MLPYGTLVSTSDKKIHGHFVMQFGNLAIVRCCQNKTYVIKADKIIENKHLFICDLPPENLVFEEMIKTRNTWMDLAKSEGISQKQARIACAHVLIAKVVSLLNT